MMETDGQQEEKLGLSRFLFIAFILLLCFVIIPSTVRELMAFFFFNSSIHVSPCLISDEDW